MDEGRWEGEGGGALHKPLGTEKSADVPISELAKDDVTARTSSTTSSAASEKQTTIAPADYNASSTHPSVIEGAEPGKAEQSKYPASAATSAAGEAKEGEEAKATPARKKSISERLSETWQDIKHKSDTDTAHT